MHSNAIGEIDLSLPNKPSIAVLPFTNMSGDPEQEYFTDGVTEDIITELSRFHSLFVIARNSTFTYKRKSIDVRAVSKELGVRYVVEGSIRRAGDRVRVTAQLIDALSGNHIWAEKYDRVLQDIFTVQEDVTRSIVTAIAPQIDAVEFSRARRMNPGNLGAYETAVRANADALEAWEKQDVTLLDHAIGGAKAALAIDPGSVLANIVVARAQFQHTFYQTAPDAKEAWRDGMRAATNAIELDRSDHIGYVFKGMLLAVTANQFDEALNNCRHAHELNPNDALALHALGWVEAICGNADASIDYSLRVLRANPRDPWAYSVHSALAYASFLGRQYSRGLEWASLALSQAPKHPASHQCAALCSVGLGDMKRAQAAFENLRNLAPKFAEARLAGLTILKKPEDQRRYTVFLRIAAGLEDPSAADALR
jgi:TolB-like protein/tetratricopeptide (TPR) repeat protein